MTSESFSIARQPVIVISCPIGHSREVMAALANTLSDDPLVGTLLANKYRIELRLGQGGMGVVYRATHVGLEHTVAIKILHPSFSSDRAVAERFAREARIIARLDSAHIVRVLDAGNHGSVGSYIVMEYLDGENLYDRLERTGPLGVAQSASYVLQAISGLEQAHEKGIVHRDLKPENLFIARTPHGTEVVKVLDFGVSKLSGPAPSELTQSQVLLGSPRYMAPEQVMSMPDVDERADVWALGVVLYELTTGEAPFAANSLAEVCAQIVNAPPLPPSHFRPELPPEFDALVLGCLHKDPGGRPQNVQQLARALQNCVPTVSSSHRRSAQSQVQPRMATARPPDTTMNLTSTIGDEAALIQPWRRRVAPLAALALFASASAVGLGWPSSPELPARADTLGELAPKAATAATSPTSPTETRATSTTQAPGPAATRAPAGLKRHVQSAKQPVLRRPPRIQQKKPAASRPTTPASEAGLPDFGGRR